MTNGQIFTKAIEKAIDRGWDMDGCAHLYKSPTALFPIHVMDNQLGITDGGSLVMTAYEIIYSHDFAKALWGEEDILLEYQLPPASHVTDRFIMESWQYHLQQMVIAGDPIDYLGENAGLKITETS
jgi:hypothetical protein